MRNSQTSFAGMTALIAANLVGVATAFPPYDPGNHTKPPGNGGESFLIATGVFVASLAVIGVAIYTNCCGFFKKDANNIATSATHLLDKDCQYPSMMPPGGPV